MPTAGPPPAEVRILSAPRPQSALDFCYEGDPDLLPVAEAQRRISAHVPVLGESQNIPLEDALGRVLAEDVVSPMDVPGHTNSAVDGFAVRGVDLPGSDSRRFEITGRALAGAAYEGTVKAYQAVRIMTGAVMPAGADSVVMLEQAEESGSGVTIGAGHKPGQNVRQAGEDLRRGDVVVRQGTRLMPAELGLLASVGAEKVRVFRPLRAACFSTGDEVLNPGVPAAPGMVYDSNRYTLRGMLSRTGAEFIDLGVVPDRRQALRDAFSAAGDADVIITSGGVSAGDADYVKETLDELGRVGFWKIAIRPGRPLAFGLIGNSVFFALPGNPVAVMVTFYQFVQPALRQMMGEREPRSGTVIRAVCESRLRKKRGRTEYYRAVLSRGENGDTVVRSTGKTGSGLLHTMSDANCFIVLGDEEGTVEPGTAVDVQPFFGLV